MNEFSIPLESKAEYDANLEMALEAMVSSNWVGRFIIGSAVFRIDVPMKLIQFEYLAPDPLHTENEAAVHFDLNFDLSQKVFYLLGASHTERGEFHPLGFTSQIAEDPGLDLIDLTLQPPSNRVSNQEVEEIKTPIKQIESNELIHAPLPLTREWLKKLTHLQYQYQQQKKILTLVLTILQRSQKLQ